ncbi:MAG: hypothetical protein KAI70_07080 [Candidatus Omnitrophica bacterium]|nr:hypothetical protein [Candidatus Omnitrophota bacterium]
MDHIMKKLSNVAITFLICALSLNVYAKTKGSLVMVVSTDKTEYKKTDGIMVTLKLENCGKNALYVNNRFFLNSDKSDPKNKEVHFIVEDPSGEKMLCKIDLETGLPRTDNFISLAPGEETEIKRPRNIKYFFDFENVGEYKITAVYQNVYGEEIGVNAFKGKIISNPVIIKISE